MHVLSDPIAQLLGPWAAEPGPWCAVFRVALAVLLAAVIGWERSSKRHSAGLRTFMLISLAGCAAALLDQSLLGANMPLLSAAAIIGMAILSCNSILFSSKNQIKGLTTSAALWACGLIGVALGSGAYVLALAAFAALLLTVSWFPRLEKYLKDRSNHFEVHLELTAKDTLQDFVSTIRALGIRIDDIEANPAYLNSGLSVYTVAITISSQELKKYKTHKEIIEALRCLEYIYYIGEL
mgnify:FL=1